MSIRLGVPPEISKELFDITGVATEREAIGPLTILGIGAGPRPYDFARRRARAIARNRMHYRRRRGFRGIGDDQDGSFLDTVKAAGRGVLGAGSDALFAQMDEIDGKLTQVKVMLAISTLASLAGAYIVYTRR